MHKKEARLEYYKQSVFTLNVMNYFNTIQNEICDSALQKPGQINNWRITKLRIFQMQIEEGVVHRN